MDNISGDIEKLAEDYAGGNYVKNHMSYIWGERYKAFIAGYKAASEQLAQKDKAIIDLLNIIGCRNLEISGLNKQLQGIRKDTDMWTEREKLLEEEIERLKKADDKINLKENEYLDISTLDYNTKQEFINNVAGLCSKDLLKTFLSCGLKTHIEQMVVNDVTGEEYILSFQTKKSFLKRFRHIPSDDKIGKAIDLRKLRDKFFKECTDWHNTNQSMSKVNLAPHDLFEWFKKEIEQSSDYYISNSYQDRFKKQDIGVWVKASEDFPETLQYGVFRDRETKKPLSNSAYVYTMEKTFIKTDLGLGIFKLVYKLEELEWLKPLKEVYVLTETEMGQYYISNGPQDRLIQKQKDEIRELTFKLSEALQENEKIKL